MIIPVPFDLFYFWLINHLITAYQVLLLEDSIYYHFFPFGWFELFVYSKFDFEIQTVQRDR